MSNAEHCAAVFHFCIRNKFLNIFALGSNAPNPCLFSGSINHGCVILFIDCAPPRVGFLVASELRVKVRTLHVIPCKVRKFSVFGSLFDNIHRGNIFIPVKVKIKCRQHGRYTVAKKCIRNGVRIIVEISVPVAVRVNIHKTGPCIVSLTVNHLCPGRYDEFSPDINYFSAVGYNNSVRNHMVWHYNGYVFYRKHFTPPCT